MKHAINFTTLNEARATAAVFVSLSSEAPPFFAAPPHAGFAPVLSHIKRGENFHGSLHEYFYACTDNDSDPSRIVLWLGDTGSQQDDNIGRLTPVAWIDLADQDKQEDEDTWSFLYHPPLLAALLTATLAEWIKAEWLGPDDRPEAGDVLDQLTVSTCWDNARKIAGLRDT